MESEHWLIFGALLLLPTVWACYDGPDWRPIWRRR